MTLPESDIAIDRAAIELTLNHPIDTLTEDCAIAKDALALGLCCCDRSPRLLALVVKYFSHYFGVKIVHDYYRIPLVRMISPKEPNYQNKKDMVILMTVFPVEKITGQIQSLFPLRQQRTEDTVRMLLEVGNCFNMVIKEHGKYVDLDTEILVMMRQKYIELGNQQLL